MGTSVSFVNPTSILRMEGQNWYRFCISPPKENYKSGFFTKADLGEKSTLHPQLRIIANELAIMSAVESFHINLGGDASDRIVVKFNDDVLVDDGHLMVIADLIGERLG